MEVCMERVLLRVEEVAKLLSIGRTKMYDLIGRRLIPTVRIGSAVRARPKPSEVSCRFSVGRRARHRIQAVSMNWGPYKSHISLTSCVGRPLA